MKLISPNELNDLINSSEEIAVIDVREEGEFGKEHILLCANISLSQLEIKLPVTVPRKTSQIVICDGNNELSSRAFDVITSYDYTNVSVLKGGVKAWESTGFEVFSGINVPSKAFGEFVEHTYKTPSISAKELKDMMDNKQDLIVLDSRPMDEYRVMNIPTGIDMPGAELVYRIEDAPITKNTTVVVNCAGRTRSIIGAQSLINAGVDNKVVALRNGTMGWHLAGYKLEHGLDRTVSEVTEEGHKIALARANSAAEKFGVKFINSETLDRWRNQQGERTLAILDVRTKEEFERAHIADSRHAPGGQLVQATDAYVATQNARVVLVDDRLVRALMTATWLVQLDWCEVYVLESGLECQAIHTGHQTNPCFGLQMQNITTVSPKEAYELQSKGALLIDVSRSLTFREKHAKGSAFAIRAGLKDDLSRFSKKRQIIFISDNENLAALAALDFAGTEIGVAVVEGGTSAWEKDGLPLEAGMTNVISQPIDVYLRAYDREDPQEIEAAMNEYLEWELGLVSQIAQPGGVSFREYPIQSDS